MSCLIKWIHCTRISVIIVVKHCSYTMLCPSVCLLTAFVNLSLYISPSLSLPLSLTIIFLLFCLRFFYLVLTTSWYFHCCVYRNSVCYFSIFTISSLLGKPQKKFFFLVARSLRGGGVRAWPLRKKNFFCKSRKKIPLKNAATKLVGGGGALARPLWPGH